MSLITIGIVNAALAVAIVAALAYTTVAAAAERANRKLTLFSGLGHSDCAAAVARPARTRDRTRSTRSNTEGEKQMSKRLMRKISLRPIVSVAVLAAAAAIVAGVASSATASPFVPRFEFNCGSAGTFFSEVNPLPATADSAFAPPGVAQVRLLTTESGDTNAVFVLLQVTSVSTGEVSFTNPGLEANQANPNLVTCIITRPDGQFQAIGLLTPAG